MTYVLWVVASLLLLDGAHGACANATSHSVSVNHLDDLLFGGESTALRKSSLRRSSSSSSRASLSRLASAEVACSCRSTSSRST
jgi:hypothetical protein